jgi:AhpD family alkylhydroperoxidase
MGTVQEFELAETEVPNKYEELIGIAVSGAMRCRYCAYFHTEAAKLFGASEEEINQAVA